MESRERVQAIIDNTAAVIYVKDMEGRYTLVNRSFEALFGVTRERATGHTDEELFPPEVAVSMRANDRRVIREHVPLEVEEVIDQADGPHTYLSTKFPLLDPRGSPTRCAPSRPTSRSASAPRRRCASPSGTSAGSSTRPTTRSSPWTRPGRITAWNPQAEATFGWTEQEALGRNLSETIIPPRYRGTHNRGCERFMQTGKGDAAGPARRARGASTATGTSSRSSSRSARCGWPARTPSTRSCTTSPSESRPRRRCAGWRTSCRPRTTRSSPRAAGGEITAWNAGAAELYGFASEEVVGRTLDMLMPPARRSDDARLLSQALAGRRLDDHETEHLRKDGSLVPVSLTVSPMRDARRAIVGASVIVRDRTERKRAEEAMREVQEAFRRAFEDAPIGMALFGVRRGGAAPAAAGEPLAVRDHRAMPPESCRR